MTIFKFIPSAEELHRAVNDALVSTPDESGCFQGVRKLRNGLPFKRIVLYASRKNGGMMPCEGRLEAAYAESLELDPQVKAYRTQPIGLPGPRGGTVVPDFAIEYVNGEVALVDVKSVAGLALPVTQERMAWVRQLLADLGIRHLIYSEKDLQSQPNCSIRLALAKGIRVDVHPGIETVARSLINKGINTVGELSIEFSRLGLPVFTLEKLILSSCLAFDASHCWSSKTLIGDFYESVNSSTHWNTIYSVVV